MELKSQFNPVEYEKEVLDNGLTVIYHQDKSVPVVSVVTHYKVGSSYETTDRAGYAHFFEHLMFTATENIAQGEIDKLIQGAGGDFNAHTSFEETVFKTTIPSHQLPLALWIESERMRKLRINENNVAKEKKVVIEEKHLTIDNAPYGKGLPLLLENMFKNTSYAWSVIGREEAIQNAKIEDFIEFYNDFYQPNNAIISISGDFELKTAKELIFKYFGSYKKQTIPDKIKFNPRTIRNEVSMDVKDEYADLPALIIGYYGPSSTDRDYAFDVLMQIMSAGESSRLHRRIVDEEQLSVHSFLFPLQFAESGLVIFLSLVNADIDQNKIIEVFDDEIYKLLENGITDIELTKAKNNIEAGFVSSKYKTINNALILARCEALFEDPGFINTELTNYLSVNADDVINSAKQYFDSKNRMILFFYPDNEQ